MFADTTKPRFARRNSGFFHWLQTRLAIARQHRHLARLDATALCDPGLTRGDVARELAQPFWMRPGFGQLSQLRQSDAARMARYPRQ